jgi:endoglucanase
MRIFFYFTQSCFKKVQFKAIIKYLVIAVLPTFWVSPDISANTAYTGMRNITSMQLTADMGAGWNLGNTLDAHGSWVSGLATETCWGNPKTTKAMIDAIKQKGFKTIRIPVTWYQHLGSAPDYTIDQAWLNRVEEVANYAFANDMYVIINIHHDDSWVVPTYAKQNAVIDQITKVWTQIANRFKNYGDYLIFETLNEPRLVGSPEEWSGGTAEGRDVLNKFHLAAVNAIRNTGGNNTSRHIMVSPYGASGEVSAIDALVIPNNDSRVIISWHNYSPYNFVLQIPGTNTWGTSSEQSDLNAFFDRIYNKFIRNGRAVVIGEWSPTDKNNTSERAKYAEFFIKAAKARQMAPIWWDNGDVNGGDSDGGSAIFNRNTLSWVYPTIADAIINNMGSCSPTAITPYLQVNGGSWQQASSVTVNSGSTVKFGPQPVQGGSWSWSGCGTSGTSREQTFTANSSCTATATYTNSCGASSTQNFNVTVNSSNITVRARGTNGSESISIQVNGNTVSTYTLSTAYQDFTANGSGTVRVAFTNDASGRDVQIDYAIINGTTYQAENQSVNTGIWQNNQCGGSYSEWIHCNGYIEFSGAGGSYPVVLRAKGVNGSETVRITVGGTQVSSWTLTTSMASYNATTSLSGAIRVEFINDDGPRDVQVDYVSISGTTHQAENQATNTGVWQNNQCGGGNSEWLNCNGYIEFSAFKSARSSADFTEEKRELSIYPNPVKSILTVSIPETDGSAEAYIYSANGRLLKKEKLGRSSCEINTSNLANGLYILKCEYNNEIVIKKFIKE